MAWHGAQLCKHLRSLNRVPHLFFRPPPRYQRTQRLPHLAAGMIDWSAELPHHFVESSDRRLHPLAEIHLTEKIGAPVGLPLSRREVTFAGRCLYGVTSGFAWNES